MMLRPAYAPESYSGKQILSTYPYALPGELVMAPSQSGIQFPEAQFLHNADEPFEIWRMTVRLTGLVGSPQEDATIIDTQPLTLAQRIRVSMLDTSKNNRMTKAPQLVNAMQKQDELAWDWDPRPFTIKRDQGIQVVVSSDAFPTICAPDSGDDEDPCAIVAFPITFVRVEVVFEGWLLVQ